MPMNLAGQLYQFQELESEIAAMEKALAEINARLGDNSAVVRAQASLERLKEQLKQLEHHQRDAEAEIEDVSAKQAMVRESLYSGRIKNPKELSSLQHEVDLLKARRDQLEDSDLDIMEQVEKASADLSQAAGELEEMEKEWQLEQNRLVTEKKKIEGEMSGLIEMRQNLLQGIDAAALTFFRQLTAQKGRAVARVEQGTCRGCGISLSAAWLQRARGGELVRCTSCGRIIYFEH